MYVYVLEQSMWHCEIMCMHVILRTHHVLNSYTCIKQVNAVTLLLPPVTV